ncbi:unnamed protein product [Sphagnum tenellum]
MIANILGQHSQLHEYAHDVEEKLWQVELESIQVNEEYMRVLQVLSKKLTYVAENHATKDYAALQDVIPEIEKLQIKAVSKVLSAQFQAYIQPLERLQLDIVTKSDLIGLEDTGTHHSPGLFPQAWEPLKNCAAVFALGNRASLLKEVDEVVIIPCIAEASGHKYL